MKPGDVQGYLYRCYDIEGRLIYIGSTADIHNRVQVHLNQSVYADRIDTVRYNASFPNVAAARVAEKEAIQTERPLLNRALNPDYAGLPREVKALRFEEVLDDTLPADRDYPDVEDERGADAVLAEMRRSLDAAERSLWQPVTGLGATA